MKVALALLGLFLVASAAWFFQGELASPQPLGPPSAGALKTAQGQQQLSLPEQRQALDAPTPQDSAANLVRLDDFLAEQWGPRWPARREELLEDGWDPGTMVDPSQWPSWEEVEPYVAAAIINGGATLDLTPDPDFANLRKSVGKGLMRPLIDKWGLENDETLNPERKVIKRATFEELQRIEVAHDQSIEPLIDAYLAAEQSYRVRQVELGNFDYGLFTLPSAVKDPTYAGPISVTGGSVNGWKYNARFQPGRDPLRAEIDALVGLKIDEIKAYIAAL